MTERAMYLSHAGTLFYVPRVRGSAAVAKLGNGARFRVSSRRGSQVRILAAASSVRFGKHFRTPPPGKCFPNRTDDARSEEHTSELQSRGHLVCRLLLEKKKKQKRDT